MAQDRYGLSPSTASAAAVAAYVDGVDRLVGGHEGAEECFDRAVAADPGFALARIGRSGSPLLAGRGAPGRAAAAQART